MQHNYCRISLGKKGAAMGLLKYDLLIQMYIVDPSLKIPTH
jgi:hypothetical protein